MSEVIVRLKSDHIKVKGAEYVRDYQHGEWIEQEDCWQCSVCGDEYVLEVGVKPIDAKMNFCPNCGADMRERECE